VDIKKDQIEEVTMDTVNVGDRVEILGFHSQGEEDVYLLSLGILTGDKVQVMAKAPFGGPISCKHQDNTFFALRRDYASKIKVKVLK
jgi:Fe2+ transport system protein FeoA